MKHAGGVQEAANLTNADVLEAVARIVDDLRDLQLDSELEKRLNERFPPEDEQFARLSALCAKGEAEGWLLSREAGGIGFGRAVKPGNEAGRFSVDVVRMKDVAGPHHVHTGSSHRPTGDAYILYLLPDGAIEFTGK